MKRIFLILKLFFKAKFIFKNPEKHELVIFDDVSLVDFKNFISNYNYFVLQNRLEKINEIYFSLKIIKLFIKNYNRNFMTAYLSSVLEIVNPKVVLTNIDNSLKFFDLAKIHSKKMIFMAIQNAARYDLKENECLYNKKILKHDINKKFFIPNFLCFGQFEIDEYKHYGIKVENFFKVGSLRLSNFLSYIKKNNLEIKKFKYDICLISESAHRRDKLFDEEIIEKNIAAIEKFTIKFCMDHNLKLIFAWRYNKKYQTKFYEREFNYYKKHLSKNELNYLMDNSLEKIKDGFTSYLAILQSKVVVGNRSTLLREKLAVGGKVLSFCYTSTNIWDFPVEGISSIKNCNYQEFEKRLLNICSMSEDDYFSKLEKNKNYTVEYDEKVSTAEIIKKKIDYFLSS
tara:strand:- start:3479 stop:4675 length:1197 start_codon:yes stop_codon:yes gene_type:complete